MTRAPRQRGFVMAAAVAMIALVGVAAAATSMCFAYEARRTRDMDIGAQQRQLVMAGMVMTQQYLGSPDRPPAGERMFAVPLAIRRASMDITWKTTGTQNVETSLIVNVNGHRIRQNATWRQDSAGWRVTQTKSQQLTDQQALEVPER